MLILILKIKLHNTVLLCRTRLTEYDRILSLSLGQHKVAMLDITGHNTAFTDTAQAIRTFHVDSIAIFNERVGSGLLGRYCNAFARTR